MGRHQNTDETGTLYQRPPDPAFRRARRRVRKAGSFAAASVRSGGRRPPRVAGAGGAGLRPRLPLWTKVCVAFGTLLSLLAFGACGAAYALNRTMENGLTRADLLGDHRGFGDAARAATDGPLNLLLIGSDSRVTGDAPTGENGDAGAAGRPADSVLLLHVPAGVDAAYVVSIPHDLHVVIPPLGEWEGGEDSLDVAWEQGGAPLLTRTVDQLSGLTVSWPVIVDVTRLRGLTDALGGIEVQFDKPVRDPRTDQELPAGRHQLTGAEADALVARTTADRPAAGAAEDGGAALRQEQYLGAVLQKAVTGAGGPRELPQLLGALGRALTVDTAMPVQDVALRLSGLPADAVYFYALPVFSEPPERAGARTMVSQSEVRELFAAMKNGTMADYAAKHPPAEAAPAP